jgi:hypothetical protein
MMRATPPVLRALCSTLILLCMLAAGRPVEQRRVLDERESKLAQATHHVAMTVVRRSSVPDGQLRQPLALASARFEPDAPRVAIVRTAQRAPARRFTRFVRSGTTRGPPV